jgi:transposase
MKHNKNQNKVHIGIDTGKYVLDVHIRPLNIDLSVSNDEKGIKTLIAEFKKYNIISLVIEATGRLEHEFIIACAKHRVPFSVINPSHTKKFAGAIGRLAKTDKLDAQLLAHYGEAIKPPFSTLKPEKVRLMSDLLSRRCQLMTMQTMEKNRMKIMPKTIQGMIKPILTAIKNQLEKVDKKLSDTLKTCKEYKERSDILQSMNGVGKVVTFTLIAEMPELGSLTNKQAASLVGVAPINRESGTYEGKRYIRGGRHRIRTVMYMAMMSAMQSNGTFKALYQRLVKAGKSKKTAIIACVRKMVITLNAMVRDGEKWRAPAAA